MRTKGLKKHVNFFIAAPGAPTAPQPPSGLPPADRGRHFLDDPEGCALPAAGPGRPVTTPPTVFLRE